MSNENSELSVLLTRAHILSEQLEEVHNLIRECHKKNWIKKYNIKIGDQVSFYQNSKWQKGIVRDFNYKGDGILCVNIRTFDKVGALSKLVVSLYHESWQTIEKLIK